MAGKDEEPEVEPPDLPHCRAQWPGHYHPGPHWPPQNWCSHVWTLDSSVRDMNHPLEHPPDQNQGIREMAAHLLKHSLVSPINLLTQFYVKGDFSLSKMLLS